MWAPSLPQQQIAWADPPIGTTLISNGQTGVMAFDVTTELASELAGHSPVYGFLIKKEAEQQSGHIELASRETATPPVLVLDYRAGAGVSVTAATCGGAPPDGGVPDAGQLHADSISRQHVRRHRRRLRRQQGRGLRSCDQRLRHRRVSNDGRALMSQRIFGRQLHGARARGRG